MNIVFKTHKIKSFIAILTLFLCASMALAQGKISVPEDVKFSMDSITKISVLKSLDALFISLQQDTINTKYLTPKNLELTTSAFEDLLQYEMKKDSISAKLQDKQLINIYPISENKLLLTISYIKPKENGLPQVQYIVNLVATTTNSITTFAIPLDYFTRDWKTKKIGNTTYHFPEQLNVERAEIFHQKHNLIATNLGFVPDELDFYMVANYQEFLKLFGFEYSINQNGNYRNGYGVDAKTIFSVMNNEDFSHDMLHYYSAKIHNRDIRNWVTEEGLAYSWGNAYYTDKDGEMITLNRLKSELKIYLEKNPKTNIFDLFWSDTKIFNHIATEISVRSAISGIILNEIAQKKGNEGIKKMLTCGRAKTMISYLKAIEELIGINRDNFDLKVSELLKKSY